MCVELHWRCQFFLHGARHRALRAAPADLVARFEFFSRHSFALQSLLFKLPPFVVTLLAAAPTAGTS